MIDLLREKLIKKHKLDYFYVDDETNKNVKEIKRYNNKEVDLDDKWDLKKFRYDLNMLRYLYPKNEDVSEEEIDKFIKYKTFNMLERIESMLSVIKGIMVFGLIVFIINIILYIVFAVKINNFFDDLIRSLMF